MSHSEKLLDSFHTFFSSQGDGSTNVRALRAPGALLLLHSLFWIHLGTEVPFQPSLGSGPAPLTTAALPLCWGPPAVHHSLVSLCPLLQLLTGAPGWSLAPIHPFPCQESWMDFVAAIVSALHSQSLWGSIHCWGMAWAGVTLRPQLMPLWEELPLSEESSSDNTSGEKWWQWSTSILQCFCVQAVRNITGSVLQKTSAARAMCGVVALPKSKGHGWCSDSKVFLLWSHLKLFKAPI